MAADVRDRRWEVEQALAAVSARVDAARHAAGRTDAVRLVVVTKTFPVGDVDLLAGLGATDVAENRDQEARAKHAAASPEAQALRWHMIGQLQRNKAASVATWADVVESVDRPGLVPVLGRAATSAGRSITALIQVNLDPTPTPGRGGALPGDVATLADLVAAEPGLVLGGVMGVAPHPGDEGGSAAANEAFARLQEISSALRRDHPGATVISAGMSGDLEEAIAHGATQVRVGGAILGARAAVQ